MELFWSSGTLQSDVAERSDFIYIALSETGKFLLSNPGVAICAAILFGVLIGKIRIRDFQFGSALGTLLSSLFISAFFAPLGAFVIDDLIKTLAFSAFVFSIGYEAGPAFFDSLRGHGGKIAILSLFYGIVVLLLSLLLFRTNNIQRAVGAGIVAGAATQSAILASAGAALSAEEQSLMAIAYAVTYVFGLLGTLIVLRMAVPALFNVKLSQFRNDNDDGTPPEEPDVSEKERKPVKIPVTDLMFLSGGIGLGILIGSLSFVVGKIPISIGSAGGSLITGLLFGWIKRNKTKAEPIPPSVSAFMKSIGLTLFMAGVGLVAGNLFLRSVSEMGFRVILIGIGITLVPHFLSVLFGKFILRLSIPAILGGLAGASTCGAALDGLLKDTGNNRTLTSSFTVGYAMGNVILTLLGPVLVALL